MYTKLNGRIFKFFMFFGEFIKIEKKYQNFKCKRLIENKNICNKYDFK